MCCKLVHMVALDTFTMAEVVRLAEQPQFSHRAVDKRARCIGPTLNTYSLRSMATSISCGPGEKWEDACDHSCSRLLAVSARLQAVVLYCKYFRTLCTPKSLWRVRAGVCRGQDTWHGQLADSLCRNLISNLTV